MSITSSVMIYDATQTGLEKKFLSNFWAAGSVLGRFDKVIAAESARDAIDQLEKFVKDSNKRVSSLQLWGHGRQGKFFIADAAVIVSDLARALGRSPDNVWFRACDVFGGDAGHKFAKEASSFFRCTVTGHTRVISAPNPLCQSGGYSLRLGEEPFWSKLDEGGSGFFEKNTCLVTTMRPPRSWLKQP